MGLLAAYLHSKGLDVTALEPGLGGFGVSAGLSRFMHDCPEFAGLSRLDLPAAELSPQAHGKFDFIYSVNVLEHIPLLEEALAAMGSVLTNGGKMLHTCPNYAVPYEPHFGVALVPFVPRLTGPLFRKHGHDELWNSLNFLTASRIKRICRGNALEVSFQPGVLHQTFLRLDQDPEFLKRQSNILVVNLFRSLKATGLLELLRFLPAEMSTPMVFRVEKACAPL
jgi:SAM-dependent methyltransferase